MAVKIITSILLIIGLGLLQVAFISALPGWLSNFNFVLIVLIFILGFGSFDLAIWWSIGIGFILEIFSFLPFGAEFLTLSLTIVIASFLLDYFFTNRSLYSFLALTVLSTLVYELMINFILLFFAEQDKYFFIVNLDFWISTFKQISLGIIFTFLIYYLTHILGRNLRPVFLIKNKKY
jgi:hypothetical protein